MVFPKPASRPGHNIIARGEQVQPSDDSEDRPIPVMLFNCGHYVHDAGMSAASEDHQSFLGVENN